MGSFTAYDHDVNVYQGCSMNCAFCYSREFPVPLQEELTGRVAIGTSYDPYQPREKKEKRTRKLLQRLIREKQVTKVGIFTRSPLILRDVDLLAQLPNVRISMTVSPFPEAARRKLEPNAEPNELRLAALRLLPGRRIVNVAPSIPLLSDGEVPRLAVLLAWVDELCVGLTCLYPAVQAALFPVLQELGIKRGTWEDAGRYRSWRQEYRSLWNQHWQGTGLAIWRDTHRQGWEKLSGGPLPASFYDPWLNFELCSEKGGKEKGHSRG